MVPTSLQQHLDAVLADPDDLDASGVYADALCEQGDPRGAFITQQLHLERCTGHEPDYPALLASTDRLLKQHELSWVHRLKVDLRMGTEKLYDVGDHQNAQWRGGFLRQLQMHADDGAAAAHIERVRRSEPLEGPELLFWSTLDERIEGSSTWRRLELTPYDGEHPEGYLTPLFAWGLESLRHLRINQARFGPAGAQRLARGLPPGQLQSLALPGAALGDAGLAALTGGVGAVVTSLNLRHNGLQGSLDLLRAFDGLRSLDLAENDALGPDLDALADWPTLGRLQHLSLPASTTPEGLASSFPFPTEALRSLSLVNASAVRRDPTVVLRVAPSLTRLDLSGCALGDDGLQALLAHPSSGGLVELGLARCSLTDASVPLLLERLPRLVRLDLGGNLLTDRGAHGFIASGRLPGFGRLELRNERLTPAGWQDVVAALYP